MLETHKVQGMTCFLQKKGSSDQQGRGRQKSPERAAAGPEWVTEGNLSRGKEDTCLTGSWFEMERLRLSGQCRSPEMLLRAMPSLLGGSAAQTCARVHSGGSHSAPSTQSRVHETCVNPECTMCSRASAPVVNL